MMTRRFLIYCFSGLCLMNCNVEHDGVVNPSNSLQSIDFWAYQIDELDLPQNIDSLCSSHYDLLVIDQQRSIKGSEDHSTVDDVARIRNSLNSKGGKKIVVCYIDVGQVENYRYYWQAGWETGNPEWILGPDPDGWNNSYGVRFWSPEWKTILKDYIGRIIEDGFDGVYLDWLMIYDSPQVIEEAQREGVDVKREFISFISELTVYARGKKTGFIFIAQNAPELGVFPEYAHLFDAIAQEDIWYDGSGDPDNGGQEGDVPVEQPDTEEALNHLTLWQNSGIPVLNVEYAQQPGKVERAYSLGMQHHFKTYVTLRLLNRLTSTPPPDY